MQCLNCGLKNDHLLCEVCKEEEILVEVLESIKRFNKETCENKNISAYMDSYEEVGLAKKDMLKIINLLPEGIRDYYLCDYYYYYQKDLFEEEALSYLADMDWSDDKFQKILYLLLHFWARNDFEKPYSWAIQIADQEGLYMELYKNAAEFFSWVGEYDIADKIISNSIKKLKKQDNLSFLYSNHEKEIDDLEKLEKLINKYRTEKPYWPQTEERREKIAAIYKEKGIAYPGNGLRTKSPAKYNYIKAGDFLPIIETMNYEHENYCCFWCDEAKGFKANSIYGIAAVKVKNGEIVGEFSDLIRPWDGKASIKNASKSSGLDYDEIDRAEMVDKVMARFFDFVETDCLVSTDALGSQANLIVRAARYSGRRQIDNEFLDLLDYIEDIDSIELDLTDREEALDYFKIKEGEDSLTKARANQMLYAKLMNL